MFSWSSSSDPDVLVVYLRNDFVNSVRWSSGSEFLDGGVKMGVGSGAVILNKSSGHAASMERVLSRERV